jgi:thymidine phosphorylase
VSASAGVLLHRKPGDAVKSGDVLVELRAEDARRIPGALEALEGATTITPTPPARRPLVSERIA